MWKAVVTVTSLVSSSALTTVPFSSNSPRPPSLIISFLVAEAWHRGGPGPVRHRDRRVRQPACPRPGPDWPPCLQASRISE